MLKKRIKYDIGEHFPTPASFNGWAVLLARWSVTESFFSVNYLQIKAFACWAPIFIEELVLYRSLNNQSSDGVFWTPA